MHVVRADQKAEGAGVSLEQGEPRLQLLPGCMERRHKEFREGLVCVVDLGFIPQHSSGRPCIPDRTVGTLVTVVLWVCRAEKGTPGRRRLSGRGRCRPGRVTPRRRTGPTGRSPVGQIRTTGGCTRPTVGRSVYRSVDGGTQVSLYPWVGGRAGIGERRLRDSSGLRE